MIRSYIIVSGETRGELLTEVSLRLDRGWVPLGGVSTAMKEVQQPPEKGLFRKRPEPKTEQVQIFIQALGLPACN